MYASAPRPAVSVILPAFNAADYLAATVRSVLGQTFSDFELLVLDNASTDNTGAVAAGFDDPRLQYRRNAVNLGYAGNVELGRSLATGRYVVIFNADDIWDPSFLAQSVEQMEAHPEFSFVHSHIALMDENDRSFGDAVTRWAPVTRSRDAFLNCFLFGFSSPTMLIRGDVLRTVGPLPTDDLWGKVADSWFFLQLCLRGDVGFIATPLMRYRVHSRSMMGESYADGSFFRRYLAIANDAFAWPEVQEWVTAAQRRRVLQHVALHAAKTLPMIRESYARMVILRMFLQIMREVPTIGWHVRAWARLAFGMLPAGMITALRQRKRDRWVARNSTVAHLY